MSEIAIEVGAGGRTKPQKPVRQKQSAVAHSAVSAPAIDRAHLARYTFGDIEIEREVLGLFCDQVSQLMVQLGLAHNRTDWCFATHSIKGSARAVGAWQVAGLAEKLEALDWDAPLAANAIADLRQALEEAIVAARAV